MKNVKELLQLIALDQHYGLRTKLCGSPGVVVGVGVWTRGWVSENWRGGEDVISKGKQDQAGRAVRRSCAAPLSNRQTNFNTRQACLGCLCVCVWGA